jgi:hypothetical protein
MKSADFYTFLLNFIKRLAIILKQAVVFMFSMLIVKAL